MSLWDCLPSFVTSAQPAGVPTGELDLLLLGSGWTSTFVLPQAAEAGLKVASTTRDGRQGTIKWTFDPESDDPENYAALPDAKTILIVFPFYTEDSVRRLVAGYLRSRNTDETLALREKSQLRGVEDVKTQFILLGSTGVYDNGPTLAFAPLSPPHKPSISPQLDLCSPKYISISSNNHKKHHHHQPPHEPSKPKPPKGPWRDNTSDVMPLPRALAENEFLRLSKPNNAIRSTPIPTTVLLLCGLWGHGRSLRHYMGRFPTNKAAFRNLGSIQMIHGRDVARAVLAAQRQFAKADGKRWILTNGRVYDLWDLASQFGSAGDEGRDHPPTGPFPALVDELMNEPGCPARSLPRSAETMFEMTNGHSLALDGREFWNTFGLTPDVGWVD